MTTVKQLIDKLQNIPQDAQVLIDIEDGAGYDTDISVKFEHGYCWLDNEVANKKG